MGLQTCSIWEAMSEGCSIFSPTHNPGDNLPFPSLFWWLSKQQLDCVNHQKVVTKSHKVNFQRTIGSSNKMAPTDFGKTLEILLLWSCHWWLTLNTICFNYPPCHWEGERLFHSVKESAWMHMTSYRIAESVNSLPNFLSGNLFPCPKSDISKGVMSWQANVKSEFKSFSITTNSTTSSTSWLHYCSN